MELKLVPKIRKSKIQSLKLQGLRLLFTTSIGKSILCCFIHLFTFFLCLIAKRSKKINKTKNTAANACRGNKSLGIF